MRIASWPHWYHPNPYLRAFYAGLEAHGMVHLPNVPLDLKSLHEAGADALHVHWAYPLWRDPRRFHEKARAVLAFHRLVRGARADGLLLLRTIHNLEHHEGSSGWDRPGERPLRDADVRIYTSEWARDTGEGAARGGTPVVVPIGDLDPWLSPDPGRDAAREALRIATDTRVLLCFGQIRPYKGFDVAVRALDRLGPPYRLVVAGRPVLPDHGLHRPAGTREDRLTLIQRELDEIELVRWLAAADVVLLPYRRITGSAALLTALSRSRGVVASDLPYFREVLGPEPDAGVLVAPDDPSALAAGIERFFDRAPRARGAAARRIAAALEWPELVTPVVEALERRATGAREPRG